ncbi:hypothetical protein [Streptomyces sp. RTd22]|uniref:hypothetical protein n=1 Tax=Streptomyces sp. RTd22 TaxID=1841249 RepID=UPI0007C4761A|nr:hypothetical protein [Streptomyces sp. RTd22]
MPGLFDAITDVLPTKARVVTDLRSDRYQVHFAKIDPSSKAAINQARLNQLSRKLSYDAPHFAHEAILNLTRVECSALHEELATVLGKTPSKTLTDQLTAARHELTHEKLAREDAVKVNARLRQEAGQHKNSWRDAEARLAQMTELYNGLLDRLTK